MYRRIEEYFMKIDKRNKQQEEFKNHKNEKNDRIYKCLVDNLTSLTVSIIRLANSN